MNMKGRLILDITQLVHWGGNLTGIPRVLNELSLRYAKEKNNIFVVWDKKANCFYELDIEKSLTHRGEGIFYKTKDMLVGESQVQNVETKEKMIELLKKATRRVKNRSPHLYKKIATKFNQQIREASGRVVEPDKDDALFVLWGEWGDDVFREKLKSLHENGVKLVNIVYDMLPILTPQYSGHSTQAMYHFYSEIIPLCDRVLSISESTRVDLIKWLKTQKLPVPKIEVFRLGDAFTAAPSIRPSTDVLPAQRIKGGYILCLGTIEARKNHTLLYYVYKLAKSRNIQLPKLIIVGRRGWKTDDIFDMMNSDPETKDDVTFLQTASDGELSWLFDHCLFSIYPSFYEGWGLPIAESIAHGKTCLSSNTSSMPEVAGKSIDYFNPVSTDECLAAITKLMDKKERDNAEKRIKKYKITTWDDTYAQVDKIIKELHV